MPNRSGDRNGWHRMPHGSRAVHWEGHGYTPIATDSTLGRVERSQEDSGALTPPAGKRRRPSTNAHHAFGRPAVVGHGLDRVSRLVSKRSITPNGRPANLRPCGSELGWSSVSDSIDAIAPRLRRDRPATPVEQDRLSSPLGTATGCRPMPNSQRRTPPAVESPKTACLPSSRTAPPPTRYSFEWARPFLGPGPATSSAPQASNRRRR